MADLGPMRKTCSCVEKPGGSLFRAQYIAHAGSGVFGLRALGSRALLTQVLVGMRACGAAVTPAEHHVGATTGSALVNSRSKSRSVRIQRSVLQLPRARPALPLRASKRGDTKAATVTSLLDSVFT